MECLALKWVVFDKHHDNLYGSRFQVVTNSNPLTNILSKAKLDPTGQRSVAAIANYNFQISYRSGHLNGESLVSSFKRSVTVLSYDLGGGFNSNGRWGGVLYWHTQHQWLDGWAVQRWKCTSSCPNPEKQFPLKGRKCEEGICRGAEVSTDF